MSELRIIDSAEIRFDANNQEQLQDQGLIQNRNRKKNNSKKISDSTEDALEEETDVQMKTKINFRQQDRYENKTLEKGMFAIEEDSFN